MHVCGDGARTAPGMREEFRALCRRHVPDADGTAAGRWLNGLAADGRYAEDAYPAGRPWRGRTVAAS
ncbi:hypothetical protein [Streptomyces sp. NPDC052701]|uniref:hypothetical protein n=1 Tax=Streptomyces sp. NPDC052701 TaxID=3155533 RepID=UPI00343E6E82